MNIIEKKKILLKRRKYYLREDIVGSPLNRGEFASVIDNNGAALMNICFIIVPS